VITASQSAEQDDDNRHAKDKEGKEIVLEVRSPPQRSYE
jgi:hypothetical protein